MVISNNLLCKIKNIDLLLLSLFIILINFIYLYLYLIKQYPLTPWDGGMLVESWRAANNIPVYEDIYTGHATHIYGVIYTYITGFINNIFGFTNYSLRVISFTSIIISFLIILKSLQVGRKYLIYLLGFALLLSVNYQVGNYFIHDRPDASALLFSLISIVCFYKGFENKSVYYLILGSLFIVLTFLIKQTYAMFAFLPLLVLIFQKNYTEIKLAELRNRLIPLIFIIITVFILKLFYENIYFFMIDIPSNYNLQYGLLLKNIFILIFSSPLFIYLIFEYKKNKKSYNSNLLLWIIASILITVPLSSFTASKVWGTKNSLIPALISINCFNIYILSKMIYNKTGKIQIGFYQLLLLNILIIVSCFPYLPINNSFHYFANYFSIILLVGLVIYEFLRYRKILIKNSLNISNRQLEYFKTLSILIIFFILSLFINYGFKYYPLIKNEIINHKLEVEQRNKDYKNIIKISKGLDGNIISPEDPTILLFSHWKADRNIYFEYDANPVNGDLPTEFPEYLNKYLLEADYIIDSKQWWYDRLTEKKLKDLNYEKINGLTLENNYYSVWKKKKNI